jgi:hypothetical protein
VTLLRPCRPDVGASLASSTSVAQNGLNLRADKSYATLDEPNTIKVSASPVPPVGAYSEGYVSFIAGTHSLAPPGQQIPAGQSLPELASLVLLATVVGSLAGLRFFGRHSRRV